MKAFKNITKLGVVGAILFMSACDPIEDRDTLTNSYPGSLDLSSEQTANGKGNGITLKMNTPGVTGWWDYILNKKNTDEVYVVFPFKGTHKFYFETSTAYITKGDLMNSEVVKDSIEVTVEELDQPLPPDYYDLIGANLEGKTWVFEKTAEFWWYMSDPGNYQSVWWNAGGDAGNWPADVDGKMVFDLAGGPNFTHYTNDADAGTKGTFAFNADYTKLFISGPKKILGNTENLGNPAGEYKIISLTAERMILQIPGNKNCGSCGHVWVFVPKP